MKFGKMLGGIVKVAGPGLIGLATAGPLGAVSATVSAIAGGTEKKRGKKAEEGGASPIHKLTAPAAAIAAPTLLVMLLEALGFSGAASLSGTLCGSPELSAALLGALSIANHQLGSGIERAFSGSR